ncbi:transaldolase [Micrococcus sp.]|uniref:transaldolase n=1 Tax=Micrococcus sp. TaxID=1271 RepID=UPI002A919FCC|nr:transaldolase [Micrococcus sp.]MDY6054471.1 transaldolase [Micrococcus sp.]
MTDQNPAAAAVQSPATTALAEAGVSVWLDDLSRTRLDEGSLETLIRTRTVTGVTTNPSIFAAALAHADAYEAQLAELAAAGADVEEAVTALTTTDVRRAADLLAPVHEATGGRDGFVSIEVDPRLARDTEATVAQARALAEEIDRPNLMVKIPATREGLPAITAVLGAGISVNVTLIFSLPRYREVVNAWLAGLEEAQRNGHSLAGIHSVASFFVSRVDTDVDAQLRALAAEGHTEAAGLTGRAGLANARLAYRIFEQVQDTERWRLLQAAGAPVQRPLWASTGVKDPALPDTLYVTGLVAPDTVNTMPEKTLQAFADHGEVVRGAVTDSYAQAEADLDAIGALGVSYDELVERLEAEGLAKFEDAWAELLASVRAGLAAHS